MAHLRVKKLERDPLFYVNSIAGENLEAFSLVQLVGDSGEITVMQVKRITSVDELERLAGIIGESVNQGDPVKIWMGAKFTYEFTDDSA